MQTKYIAVELNVVLFAAGALSVVFAIGPAALYGQPAYTATPLGTLDGTSSFAIAINNSGRVVGNAFGKCRFKQGAGNEDAVFPFRA